jgi:hypothetical protein
MFLVYRLLDKKVLVTVTHSIELITCKSTLEKGNKNTTQYVLDITMHKQTQK